MKKKILLLNLILGLIIISGCASNKKPVEAQYFAFDTYMKVSFFEPKVGKTSAEITGLLINESERLENLLSVTRESSEVFEINSNGSREGLSADVSSLLLLSKEIWEKTGGAFDVSSYPYTKAWGFTTGTERVPDKEELSRLKECVGFSKISFDDKSISLPENGMVDFGGIAKGYLGDVLAEKLIENKVESAMLSLGGNIRVIGNKPTGELWKIGIADPENPTSICGYVSVENTNVVTSGGYERFFVGEDGKEYCHIIDPKTGIPVDNNVASVTVIGECGAICDALSTGVYVLGEEGCEPVLSAFPEYSFIIITKDKKIKISDEIKDSFTLSGEYKVEEITE